MTDGFPVDKDAAVADGDAREPCEGRVDHVVVLAHAHNGRVRAEPGQHGVGPEQFLSIFLESALEEQNGVRGLRMTVEDNGCGFSPEMLASFPVKEDNGHVGLSNLYHTLQLIYGPAASLHISNAEPNGARVTIFLPEEENHAHPSCG